MRHNSSRPIQAQTIGTDMRSSNSGGEQTSWKRSNRTKKLSQPTNIFTRLRRWPGFSPSGGEDANKQKTPKITANNAFRKQFSRCCNRSSTRKNAKIVKQFPSEETRIWDSISFDGEKNWRENGGNWRKRRRRGEVISTEPLMGGGKWWFGGNGE